MKQFIIIAYDAKDDNAQERRMATRDAHTQLINKLRDEGKVLCGSAILDAQEKMIGPVVITNFASRAEFDKYLAIEPYAVNKVWDNITVLPGRLGPSFADLLEKAA
jgi:uncharacterized protein YciI